MFAVFALVALTIVASIVLHWSTDVLVGRGFAPELMPAWQQRLTRLTGRSRRLLRRSPPATEDTSAEKGSTDASA